MQATLQEMHDFKYEKNLKVCCFVNNYKGFFIPKFHCELNPIERVWAHSKKHTRAHCDYSFAGLENTVAPALNSVTQDLIRKSFRKMRDYMAGYRGLVAGPELETIKNTSHNVKYMKRANR